jgi:hypothetical protein
VIRYLTGVSNELTRAECRDDLGLLGTPAGSTWKQKNSYPMWAADNGCFAELKRPGCFVPARWLEWLELAGSDRCLWATLPDVVGDARATWTRSEPYVDRVRALGFPVSIVMQDGLESEPFIWRAILNSADAVFIGGSTDWKLSTHAARLSAEAKRHGLTVHMGRVNSWKRLAYAASIGCDTADGTYLNFGNAEGRAHNTRRLLGWLDRLNGARAA